MNSRQKRVQQAFLDNEKAVLKKLESNYKDALDEINDRIAILLGRQDADLQHVVYQLEYQKSLKKQVEAILEALHSNEFETVSEYLTKSYDEGFIGTMYDLQGQGIPLVFPIDQEQVVAAIQHETKLSESLYTTLGKDTKKLSKQIAHEISRGISNNATYGEIARNIENLSNIPKNNAARIARTEAHRIQCQATADAQFRAKAKGADVVKQWDSTLDGNTRPVHRELDGQIRELEEPFEAGGYKVMQPGGFGDPSQDCNCRCALLQRARWALGNDFTKWDKESNGIVKIKAEDYDDFKMKYSKESERVRSDVQKINPLENNAKSSKIGLNLQFFAKIPEEKFTEYALDPLKAPDKAKAFQSALGYNKDNYDKLIANIESHIDESKFIEKGDKGHGMRYEYVMKLKGANGKEANVMTAWIDDNGEKRLTSVYVTKKKVTE